MTSKRVRIRTIDGFDLTLDHSMEKAMDIKCSDFFHSICRFDIDSNQLAALIEYR